jgi:hypothetical protein
VSERVALPVASLSLAILNCSAARWICRSAAATSSLAARALKNSCFVCAIVWNRWSTRAASALAVLAPAARLCAMRLKPSNRSIDALRPVEYEVALPLTWRWVAGSNRLAELRLQPEFAERLGSQLPTASRCAARATSTSPSACTMVG